MKIGIIGCGAYAIALSSILENKDFEITMWTAVENEYQELNENHTNLNALNYRLNKNIKFTMSLKELLQNNNYIILAIPAKYVKTTIEKLKPYYKEQEILIATKGMEQTSNSLLHHYLNNILKTDNITCISGPTFAKDIILKNNIGLNIA